MKYCVVGVFMARRESMAWSIYHWLAKSSISCASVSKKLAKYEARSEPWYGALTAMSCVRREQRQHHHALVKREQCCWKRQYAVSVSENTQTSDKLPALLEPTGLYQKYRPRSISKRESYVIWREIIVSYQWQPSDMRLIPGPWASKETCIWASNLLIYLPSCREIYVVEYVYVTRNWQ